MKAYVGAKIIHAEPCTLGDYRFIRGHKVQANENTHDAGYMLRYPDGYLSWSPAATFEAAYRLVTETEAALINTKGPEA